MKSAAVLTYGCAHNQKDSQLMEAQLLKHGFTLVDEKDAELVIVNSCTVKEPTESKIISKLDSLRGRPVVVTGCLSQATPEKIRDRYPEFLVMGVNAAPYLISALEKHMGIELALQRQLMSLPVISSSKVKGLSRVKIEEEVVEKPLLESTRWNPNLNIIQINEGCLNSCTFCATKMARGRLHSFRRESIIESIRRTPTPEVWLTSQDTGCWGFDIGDNIGNLLKDIDRIGRKFWLRVGMGNPNNFIKVLDEAIEGFRSDKVYKFLHLPVQSGSNRVLKHMRRGYTVEEYELIVERFREVFPSMTLSTDVIVGYPTETEDEFEETVRTVERTRPSITNISRYWERSGTPAAELEQLPHSERKRRSGILTEITKRIQTEDNLRWIDWEGEALAIAAGTKGGVEMRNIDYKPIIVDSAELGEWYNVRITRSTPTHFFGEIVE